MTRWRAYRDRDKATGEREVVGVDVGPAEDLKFWKAFLRQLVSRGLGGVRLLTSTSISASSNLDHVARL